MFERRVPIPIEVIVAHKYELIYKYVVATSTFPSGKQEDLSVINNSAVDRLLQIDRNCVTPNGKALIQYITSVPLIIGIQRCYDIPMYPSREALALIKSQNSLVVPDDLSVRKISLCLHLYSLKSDLVKSSYKISSSVVTQVANEIVLIYHQICSLNLLVHRWRKYEKKTFHTNDLNAVRFFSLITLLFYNRQWVIGYLKQLSV